MNFNEFYDKLKDNPIWWDSLPLAYPHRNMMQIARQYHSWLVGMEDKFDNWQKIRVVFQKFLWQAGETHEPPKVDKAEPVEIHPRALTGEERANWLRQWQDAVNNAEKWVKPKVILDVDEEGAERKKQIGSVYPSTSRETLEAKERHRKYLIHCYDANTGQPNKDWVEESEFNKLLDAGLI